MIKKSVILILIISFFLSGIIILKSNFVIARNDNPSIYSIDLIPLKDKNAWFPEHKKTFTSKDKGVIIEVGWYKLKPKKYNFGIKTYRPDGDIDTLTMTHEVKEKELGDKGQFDWWWQYSFKEDNLLNYLGKWKVDFLLNGKKKGESNFIIQ